MDKTLLVINTNNMLSENSRQSFKDACRRWGCDYTEITQSDLPYHHATLKLRAFDLCAHERVFVIDSDTIIRGDTPNLFEMANPERFYAVKNQQAHFPAPYVIPNVQIAERDIRKVIEANGLSVDIPFLSNNFFNSGVFIVSREYHKHILDQAYDYFISTPGMQWWDQIPLNVAVNINGGYEELPPTFNYQFPNRHGFMSNYIYHFAGDPTRYEILKTINWMASDPKVLDREQLHTLINEMELKIGVELGTQQGLYSEYLLRTTNLFLYMVDAWRYIEGYNDIANVSDSEHMMNISKTKRIVSPYIGRWKIIREFSVLAAKQFEDSSVDFIYVDADHSYNATLLDLQAWYPKLRSGGLMAGHDFLDGENICGSEFGVRSAVFEFLKDKTHRLYTTGGAWPTWWYVKEN